MASICDNTASDLVKLLKTKAISPVALLDSCLERIAAVNPAVNAVVTLDEAGARAEAKAAEAARLAREAEEAAARLAEMEAEQKAKRDARYAARKARGKRK